VWRISTSKRKSPRPFDPRSAIVINEQGDMLMLITIAGAVLAGFVAGRDNDPIEDLTAMVRTPIRWALAHPVRALRKLM
jgi:hypothetical protein